MTSPTAPSIEYDPFSPEVMSDPRPYYQVLRKHAPVYYMEKYDTYFFSTFDGVMELLGVGDNIIVPSETSLPTPELVRTTRHSGPLPLAGGNPMQRGNVLPSPYYEQMRLAHMAPFRPRAAAAMQDFVRERARERLSQLIPRKTFDLTREFAGVIAASVVLHIFGRPLDLAEQLLDLVNEIVGYNPVTNKISVGNSGKYLDRYIIPAIQARRASPDAPAGPLLDGLINYRTEEGRALDDEEILRQLTCAMIAGTESVPKITAHGILELWQRPEQLAVVRADLARNVPIAVQEIVRFCNPIQFSFRSVHKDVTIAGQDVRAGQRVVALFYSATRDEREFDDPEAFVWDRAIPRVLTFGFGQHHCIGKHVALTEIAIMVQEFLSAVKSFHFVMEEAVRNPSYFQWGWQNLPVVIDD